MTKSINKTTKVDDQVEIEKEYLEEYIEIQKEYYDEYIKMTPEERAVMLGIEK